MYWYVGCLVYVVCLLAWLTSDLVVNSAHFYCLTVVYSIQYIQLKVGPFESPVTNVIFLLVSECDLSVCFVLGSIAFRVGSLT